MYAAAEGIPSPVDEWDEEFLFDYTWDEQLGHPVAPVTKKPAKPIEFGELSESLRVATLVKHHSTEIDSDQLRGAIELQQDDSSTFDGHIYLAITKTPSVAVMYPERILEAIDFIRENCAPTKKWPEIKGALAGWLKNHEADRKDGGVTATSPDEHKPGSGDPKRFDLVLALLVMGKEPSKAGASDVKNAKYLIETREAAWRAWRTTLVGVPGIYSFPEQLLYELTLDGMKDLNLIGDNASRLAYVRKHFAGHPLLPDYIIDESDNHETEQDTTTTIDPLDAESPASNTVAPEHSDDVPTSGAVENTTSVERIGPFYYRTVAGDKIGRANKLPKLQEVIAQGCVEISQEEYQERKTGTYQAPQETSEKPAAQTEVKKIADGVFSIDNLMAEQPKAAAEQLAPSNEVVNQEAHPKAEPDAAQPVVDFQSVGASLEKDLQDKSEDAQDNLKIWRSVMRTDPRFTKQMTGTGFEGTSINAEYMIMRATEIFGPIGSRWGFEILEDHMIPGAPFSEPVYEDKKFIGNRMLRDGDGTLLFEQNHSLKIRLWYTTETDEGSVHAYGATPYMYKTKNGIKCDGEAQKKSLTDALKKALSLLGFSADVWLGLYDLPEYQAENITEFAIKNASDKAEDVTRLRNELDEKLTRVANTIENAVSTNEAKKVFDTLAREVEVHRKAAEAKGDQEHAKYLSGRLRRLSQIKDQRIKTLTENQEQSA
ncbi:exodeoxyribonuclease VIII [Enterobacter sp. CPE_E1241]|uniref:exodeoxyribonuclease VIII n=1 Tax=Enterobacter sp. CPE_E1241 TaxID=3376801 RepID=UPI00388E8FAC